MIRLSAESRYARGDFQRGYISEWRLGKSGGGPYQSKTLAQILATRDNAERFGVRQSSGAFGRLNVHAILGRQGNNIHCSGG
jgi:hypothetical protein